MLHKSVLPEKSFELLKKIMQTDSFDDFYLAGGTSLALQIGHRISIDLDLFTQTEFTVSILHHFPESYSTNFVRRNSAQMISKETKVELMYWAFPIIFDFQVIEGIRLLDSRDIGLMKLLAVQGRTTKKDIIDLYYIDRDIIPIEELISLFEKHYPKEHFNLFQSLKDLFDSEQIFKEPMPRMTENIEFKFIYESLREKITLLLKKILIKD